MKKVIVLSALFLAVVSAGFASEPITEEPREYKRPTFPTEEAKESKEDSNSKPQTGSVPAGLICLVGSNASLFLGL